MSAERFFVWSGDGIEFYETADEAKQAADFAIQQWKSACDPEWPEEVEEVCWGRVKQRAKVFYRGENLECTDYALQST